MMKQMVIAVVLATMPMLVFAQNTPVPAAATTDALLEPPGAILLPVSNGSSSTEVWGMLGVGNPMVRNVTQPTLTPFLPDPDKATGAAVIVAPGGGFVMLSMQTEGWQVARWLADHGVAAFVLKYRTDATPVEPGQFAEAMRKMMAGVASSKKAIPIVVVHPSTDDALASLRLIRSRAAEWHIDPKRVGIVGFSAGAMLALRVALHVDPAARPDFAAPIYPPLTAVAVPADAPPLFVAMAADDQLFGKTDFALIQAWHNANRPIEFHYYDSGGHGFGMVQKNTTSDLWIDQFFMWLKARGIVGN